MSTTAAAYLRRLCRTVVAAGITLAAGGIGATAVLSLTSPVVAAPEPDPVPKRWQLKIEPGPLRMITLDSGDGPRQYLYFTYRVTNNTGQDLLFAPLFELADAEANVSRSGRGVPTQVTKAILELLDNPLLEDQIGIIGMLQQGEENAKDGVVIWPVQDLNAGPLELYAAGFSGETATLTVTNPRTGQPERVVLRKTMMLRYRVPGTLLGQGAEPLEVIERRWIMR